MLHIDEHYDFEKQPAQHLFDLTTPIAIDEPFLTEFDQHLSTMFVEPKSSSGAGARPGNNSKEDAPEIPIDGEDQASS